MRRGRPLKRPRVGDGASRITIMSSVSRRVLVVASVAIVVSVAVALLAAHGSTPPPHPVANRAFPSSTSSDAPAELWAVGDGADGSTAARTLARDISRAQPDRFLYLGDVYEHGSADDFARHYAPVYGRLATRTAPTPGNHEWPDHPQGYDRYWRTVTGQPTPPWYAFRLGDWQLISLNSEAPHDAGSAQLRWLRQTLRAPGTCRLAFWHRPRYSAGSHGDQADTQPFWDALRGHATMVLGGHDHDLQRMRPRDGITELVAGAGGHSHYAVDRADPRLSFADDRHDGAVRLRLAAGRADIAFVDAAGRTLDRSSVRCRAPS